MAKGIKIDVLSDVSEFVQGAKKAGASVDDFASSLDDMVRDGKDAGKKTGDGLEKGIKDGVKDAGRETEKLEDKFSDIARSSRRAGDDAGDGLRTGVKRGTDGGKESLDEFKGEANSTAKETFASFDGTAEGITGAFQELAANAFQGFGPAGVAAGFIAAAGIGLVTSAMSKGQEDSEAFKEDVAELAEAFIDAGGRGEAAFEAVADKLREMATETDEGKTSLNDLADAADGSGRNYKDLARVVAGAGGDITDMLKDARKQQIELTTATKDYANTDVGMAEKAEATGDYVSYLEEAKKKTDEAKEAEANWLRSGGPELELRASMVETYQQALDDSLGSFDEFKDAETGALDPQGFIDSMIARNEATAIFSSNVDLMASKYALSTDEIQRITDQGVDFGPMLQAAIDAGLDDELISQIRGGVDGGQKVLLGADLNGTVKVDADVDPAVKKADAEAKKKRDGEIVVKADTKPAAKDIQAAADKDYKAQIDVKVRGLAGVTSDIDRAARDRTSTITFNIKRGSGQVPKP